MVKLDTKSDISVEDVTWLCSLSESEIVSALSTNLIKSLPSFF